MDFRQLIDAVSAHALGAAFYVRVGRELGVVEDLLAQLTRDECVQVATQLAKSLERNEITAVREEAFARARSDSAVMRRTGLAQWLATAFLETRDADGDAIRERHKAIEKTIRGLHKRAEPPVRAKAATS